MTKISITMSSCASKFKTSIYQRFYKLNPRDMLNKLQKKPWSHTKRSQTVNNVSIYRSVWDDLSKIFTVREPTSWSRNLHFESKNPIKESHYTTQHWFDVTYNAWRHQLIQKRKTFNFIENSFVTFELRENKTAHHFSNFRQAARFGFRKHNKVRLL